MRPRKLWNLRQNQSVLLTTLTWRSRKHLVDAIQAVAAILAGI